MNYCVILTLFLQLFPSHFPQEYLTRADEGLRGPVHTVRWVRTSRISGGANSGEEYESDPIIFTFVYDRVGRLVEALTGDPNDEREYRGKRVYVFDSHGSLTASTWYGPSGKEVSRLTYVYDAARRPVRSSGVGYLPIGPPKRVKFTAHYAYTAAGKMIDSTVTEVSGGAAIMRDMFTYDAAGKFKEYESFIRDKRISKTTYEYDASGRLARTVEQTFYQPSVETETYFYDGGGNLVEKDRYEEVLRSSGYREVYSYEFDTRGNWVRQNMSLEIYERDGTGKKIIMQLEPRDITRRTITYYE